jgi:hypothetical protein
MAIQTNYTTPAGVDLTTGYTVVTNVQIHKILNDRITFNPDTEADEVTAKHYTVTYSADIYLDKAARDSGLDAVTSLGDTPGDLSFTTPDITDVVGQCYTDIAEFLEAKSTEV